jgi:hypothetical protein
MNLTGGRKFYVIDFSAGNLITHHLNYALAYCKFITSKGYECELFTPTYLNSTELDHQFKINKILYSRNYKFLADKFTMWSIYFKLLKFLGTFAKYIESLFGRWLISFYIHVSYKKIVKSIHNNTIEVIFPSTDFMAILLLEKMLSNKAKISRFYLRLNAVDKNLYDPSLNIDGLEILENLIKKYPNIILGCETKNLIDNLVTRSRIFKKAIWIPLPSNAGPARQISKNIYGFLGGAKKRKGFDEIPFWVKKISQIDSNAHFLIQQSPFIWPGYLETIAALKSFNNTELLAPVLTNKELFLQIERCSFLVAPYDASSYNLVGSSLFYYAADFLIPAITYAGVGFSHDISEFGCGLLLKNLEDHLNLNEINKNKLQTGLVNYNIFRNKQNASFLNFTSAD